MRQPSRRVQDPFREHIPKILADNILAKAKESRARVEEQIKKMYSRITSLFKNNQPIPFLKLILTPNPDGIVRTLLYLLQLVNRKRIEIWQKVSDGDDSTMDPSQNTDTGLDIFVTPAVTLKTSKESRSPSENHPSKK